MTWEEIIIKIQSDRAFQALVEDSYLDKDLIKNAENFSTSNEWRLTLELIRAKVPSAARIADIGAGNGISSIALAKAGYEVTAIEPDTSEVVGTGAIKKLAEYYQLNNITLINSYAESIPVANNYFDAVYVRQAMHHANDLTQFLKEIYRILKPGGFVFTIRDHVILNETDKAWFLDTHPLHKFYQGENAYTKVEYIQAFQNAKLTITSIFKFYDTPINYYPISNKEVKNILTQKNENEIISLSKLVGLFAKIKLLQKLYAKYLFYRVGEYEENKVPGRMYSFIACKTK